MVRRSQYFYIDSDDGFGLNHGHWVACGGQLWHLSIRSDGSWLAERFNFNLGGAVDDLRLGGAL